MNHFHDSCVPLYPLLPVSAFEHWTWKVTTGRTSRVLQLSEWDVTDGINLLQERAEDLGAERSRGSVREKSCWPGFLSLWQSFIEELKFKGRGRLSLVGEKIKAFQCSEGSIGRGWFLLR